MEDLEKRLAEVYACVDRYVKYRLNGGPDAEDLVQEICLTACAKAHQLEDPGAFKAWVLRIARNRCADYFRRQTVPTVPLEDVPEEKLAYTRQGLTVVQETVEDLPPRDREILKLYFWEELPQRDIARQLGIPVGTVKSRLHTAKNHFRERYPYPPKGEIHMKKLPERLPEYTIEWVEEEPFACKWEELQGWLIVPRLGEKLSWGLYEHPTRQRTEYTDMAVVGQAEVHGIRGVEIVATQYSAEDYYRTGCVDKMERRFVAQLTDTHCRYLAESHEEDGVRRCFTFLDGDAFLNNWGFGENNCGNETNLAPKGLLTRQGSAVTGQTPREVVDVVGRALVTVGGKRYDTVCVMDIQCFNDGVASEQYLDPNGRTVLWRRFNHDRWAMDRFGGKPWSEKLPDNERLTVNGETYVHWYDCISDYIL